MKWTTRKNGTTMATFRLRFHVPQEMCVFLQEHTGMSRTAAERFIWENWNELTHDSRQLAVYPDGEPFFVDVNNIDTVGYEDCAIYDGPEIAVTS
jgi:hypothetical protein